MTDKFQVARPLYPVLSIGVTLFIFIGALAMARSLSGVWFLAAVFLLLCIFGYGKTCLKMIPFLIIYTFVVTMVFYLASGRNLAFAGQMAIRLAGVAIAVIPGMSLPPANLVRNLTALNCPRLLTLGMLITMTFIPVLNSEIRQVKGAMKTRGVNSIWSLTGFYRAFLIPLIVRLVNISDTLALSVETRGFVAENTEFTIYHPVSFTVRDGLFAVLFLIVWAGGILIAIMGVMPL